MELVPKVIKGNSHKDDRGALTYNNQFDLTAVKRIYIIDNATLNIKRGWQGHKIEQRWFSAVKGSFKISLIKIDNWDIPSTNLLCKEIQINSKTLDVLHVPKGYVSCIQALEKDAKLLVMADYLIGEIKDEYRYNLDYFDNRC